MAYINYSTFTQVDTNNYWTVEPGNNNRLNAIDLVRNDDSYVYKDYGADYFEDFEHYFDFQLTDGTPAGDGNNGLWGVTNNPGSYTDMSNGIIVFLYGDTGWIYLAEKGGDDTNYQVGISQDITYYAKVWRSGTDAYLKVYPTYEDRANDLNEICSLNITCSTTKFRYLVGGFSRDASGSAILSTYVENLQIAFPVEIYATDTLILSDESYFKDIQEPEGLGLSDSAIVATVKKVDVDNDFRTVFEYLNDIDNNFITRIEILKNIDNKFSTVGAILTDIDQKINTAQEELNDAVSQFNSTFGYRLDIDNDIRTLGRTISDVENDIRFLKSWQIPAEGGFQSLGKSYIKVYINSEEQTDIDVDTITITESLNGAHTASFTLSRVYDSGSKPIMEQSVEIKYYIWTLFKGYVSQITPTDKPDSIKITAQDEYWKQNQTESYFFVGHQPSDNRELYYDTIAEGLSALSANFGIGNFIPETIDCFGQGESDCITRLVTQVGNYSWYYEVNKNSGSVSKQLWTSGGGTVKKLDRQVIGTNLNIYQVLTNNLRESVENLVNKFRVQMGDLVIRRFSRYGGSRQYATYEYEYTQPYAYPAWNRSYEILAKNSGSGYGWDYHTPENSNLYQDVFKIYDLPSLDPNLASWTDRYEPKVKINVPFGGEWNLSVKTEVSSLFGTPSGVLKEGFTIDYENGELRFTEPVYLYKLNEYGELDAVRAPSITVYIAKKKYHTNTESPSDDPTTDITNPLMFFTNKMGSYATTILKNLTLSQFSIQVGGWYQSGINDNGTLIYTYIPSWNDTDFAEDYANWQLSQNCDKKVEGTIELLIDTMCFYNITLKDRIYISGITENALNIESITYNISSFTASLNLKKGRTYTRTINLPNHGV